MGILLLVGCLAFAAGAACGATWARRRGSVVPNALPAVVPAVASVARQGAPTIVPGDQKGWQRLVSQGSDVLAAMSQAVAKHPGRLQTWQAQADQLVLHAADLRQAFEALGSELGNIAGQRAMLQQATDSLELKAKLKNEAVVRGVTTSLGATRAMGESYLQAHHAWTQMVEKFDALRANMNAVSLHVSEVADAADNAANIAESGYRTVHATIDSIEQAQALATTALQRTDELNDQTHRIDGVVRFIEDIARQTNLLSLNAAIVAAQSSNGHAFRVIAHEIKELSDKTRASTLDIAGQISRIHADNSAVKESITGASKSVDEALQRITKAGDALAEIREESQRVSRAVQASTTLANATAKRERTASVAASQGAIDGLQMKVQEALMALTTLHRTTHEESSDWNDAEAATGTPASAAVDAAVSRLSATLERSKHDLELLLATHDVHRQLGTSITAEGNAEWKDLVERLGDAMARLQVSTGK